MTFYFALAVGRKMGSLASHSMIATLIKPSIARAAILPVAGVLAAITGFGIIVLAANNSVNTVASLLEKATLTAHVTGPNAAAAVWQFDTLAGERILHSLASDPDFGSGIIVDDKGDIFASLQNGAVKIEVVTPTSVAALLGVADPEKSHHCPTSRVRPGKRDRSTSFPSSRGERDQECRLHGAVVLTRTGQCGSASADCSQSAQAAFLRCRRYARFSPGFCLG